MKKQLWVWHWISGGYNHCQAETREEALRIGNAMSKNLKVDEKTLHRGTWNEVHALDRQYASLFY